MACWRLTTKNKTINQGPRQKRGPFFFENVLLIIKKPFPKKIRERLLIVLTVFSLLVFHCVLPAEKPPFSFFRQRE